MIELIVIVIELIAIVIEMRDSRDESRLISVWDAIDHLYDLKSCSEGRNSFSSSILTTHCGVTLPCSSLSR